MLSLDETIILALREDLGEGDHTTLSTIPATALGKARLLVKQAGILAGVAVARRIFELVDPELSMKVIMEDGTPVQPGMVAFHVEGPSRSILIAERLVLNFMQRMSGIATTTRKYVDAIAGLHAKILDTRKTTPNFRLIEKEAVKIGGGYNHRFGLYDMILVKDNHIDFAGGIPQAIKAVQTYCSERDLHLPVEIEARSVEDVRQIMEVGGVDRIMLDNFTPDIMKQAVDLINKRYETEASGGITLETIREYAATGVDFISVGALTHQVSSLDLSLKAF